MRILLADDHDMVRETISAFLETKGDASVVLATDLAGALDKIKTEGPFDLVLLDYQMPGMHGLTGLSEAITANGGKGVAILSGNAPAQTAQEALKLGAIGFIPKTMGAQSLLNAVRFMVAGEVYVPVDLMRKKVPPRHIPWQKSSARGRMKFYPVCARGNRTRKSPAILICRKSRLSCMCARSAVSWKPKTGPRPR